MESPVTKLPRTAYLGRQPIYSGDREIRAYELLYRGAGSDTTARFQDGDQASAQVLLRAFLEFGLPAVSPEQPVFVNHTRHLLQLGPILPADRCVIEVLEDVTADEDTIAALWQLKNSGYRIALDDFVYSDSLRPMVDLADYIKLDLRALGREDFARHIDLLRPYRMPVVAEKIENEEEFRWCKELGCRLFQGYYLLDSLFNEPLQALVEPLPLDVRFKRALLLREGTLGAVLTSVIEYEGGDWSPGEAGPSAAGMHHAFWEAAEYARSMMAQMASAASS